ncbi:MAG: FixH family protein [Candidatus Korobacteraceae bacterium]
MSILRTILMSTAVAVSVMAMAGCNQKAGERQSPQTAASPADATSPWRIELKISPDHPSMTKPMSFSVHISDEHGQPVNDAQVTGALTMKLMDMGTMKVNFAPKGSGEYQAQVKSADMSGPWNLAVDAAQGSTHVKKDFEVVVGD